MSRLLLHILTTAKVTVYMHTRPDFVVVVEGAWKSATSMHVMECGRIFTMHAAHAEGILNVSSGHRGRCHFCLVGEFWSQECFYLSLNIRFVQLSAFVDVFDGYSR